MARFHMKKFGLVLPDGEATKRYRDNWESTFGKKQPIEVKENPLETPNPGSQEAVDMGCLCPVMDNHYGQGWHGDPNKFCINGDCPVHNEL